MAIVGGLDVHRKQITFDYVDLVTGQVRRGRVPGTRRAFRDWLARIDQRPAAFAVEGCTGWRFIVEELRAAGMEGHLAEPADTRALRGPKRHAKTDGIDARHLRELLQANSLPESWIPPQHVQEMRIQVRLYKDLLDERTTWQQRIQALLFHQGINLGGDLLTVDRRQQLEAGLGLSPAARDAVQVALRQIDRLAAEMAPMRQTFARFARLQPGCRALTAEYGIGPLLAVVIWAELGDCRRFSSSRDAVRHTGIDITVHSSDGKRSHGVLARQGPPLLRWALVEAAQSGARETSPDHPYFDTVKERLGGTRAALSLARKLVRRIHHRLRELGDRAMMAVDEPVGVAVA
ncbi:MAG TPA: IS110 family transposase [Candidatus Acidoferrum sp.]|nr:IS110 family transposase [Candidatus Acidoferrum sp.]